MRYEKGHRSATRQHILEIASKRFRESGFAAVGLTGVMKEAGLTNGGFYLHFESKEALVCEALTHALDSRQAAFETLGEMERTAALETGIRAYLSAQHRDDASQGCPSAALLPEIGRHSEATRQAYEARFLKFIALVERLLAASDAAQRRATATSIFALLAGTLQLARAVSCKELSDEILESGVKAALLLSKA